MAVLSATLRVSDVGWRAVGRVNFKCTHQQKRVGELSGGERGPLHMPNTLKQCANLLNLH